VEGNLFRIPREYIAQASPVFLDMLNLPQPATENEPGNPGEGTTDATPLVLPDTVKSTAFRSLIRLLYPNIS
jgi:hypothetical protein